MAKKKPKSEAEPEAADRHKNTVVSFRPAPELRAAIGALAVADRRSMAQMIEILLEEALKARGCWPSKKGGE
jgi:hypothetical protein